MVWCFGIEICILFVIHYLSFEILKILGKYQNDTNSNNCNNNRNGTFSLCNLVLPFF